MQRVARPLAEVLKASPPQRILIASLDNVGDLIFTSALVPPLRRAFPAARIVLWCKAYVEELSSFIAGVDSCIASDPFWDRSPGRPKGSISDFVAAWRALRRERFDLAVITSRHWRVAAAVAVAGVPIRIGYDRRHTRVWLTHRVAEARRDKPVVAELARLLEPLQLGDEAGCYALDVGPARERQRELRARLGPAPVVALHPFASRRDRCVDFAIWRAVATDLAARGLRPLWVGTPHELDAFRAAGGAPPTSLYGDQVAGQSLADLTVLLACAALFIGHDSGPLHMAASLGIPSLGIFAPGEPLRTFPQGTTRWRMIAADSPATVGANEMLAAALSLRDAEP